MNDLVTPDRDRDIAQSKELRVKLDNVLTDLHKAIHNRHSRERSIAVTKLQEAIMWLGMDLKDIGTPTPYPNSYNPSNTIVDKTADNLRFYMTDLGFKPHGKRILVQPVPPPKQVGSIILPSTALEQRPGEAIVVALGGKWPAHMGVRVGDRVYTDRFQGQPVEIKGQQYRLHAPEEILAVVEQA